MSVKSIGKVWPDANGTNCAQARTETKEYWTKYTNALCETQVKHMVLLVASVAGMPAETVSK